MEPNEQQIHLVIIEDHPKFIKTLERIFSFQKDLKIVAQSLSGEGGLIEIEKLAKAGTRIDLALVDLELPGIDGIGVTLRIKDQYPQIEILILTTFEDEDRVYRAMMSGASGYLLKTLPYPKIMEGIREVHRGGVVIEAKLARRFWNFFKSQEGKSTGEYQFSEEEVQILNYLAKGLTNQEVGQVLNVSSSTVKNYLEKIFAKFEVNSRVSAVVKAIKYGIVSV